MAANDIQIGGEHYKANEEQTERARNCGVLPAPEPWDFSFIRGHNNLQAGVIKYVDRYLQKNGLQDLQKAKHYLDKMLEIEERKVKVNIPKRQNEIACKERGLKPGSWALENIELAPDN